MDIFKVLAILGALAWLPHLIKLAKELFIIPNISIITQRNAEIGHTTYGPIINIRLAFATKHKEIVISSIKIRLIHESGDEKVFSWRGITQPLLQMRNVQGTSIPMEKEHSVLAIRLNPKEIEERLIRFQDEDFHKDKEIYETKAAKKLMYLKEKDKFDVDEYLHSEEINDLTSFIKHSFNWKQGLYYMIFEIDSNDKFNLNDNKYSFSLSALDIEVLEKNKDTIEIQYENELKSVTDKEYELKTETWNWRNPIVKKQANNRLKREANNLA